MIVVCPPEHIEFGFGLPSKIGGGEVFTVMAWQSDELISMHQSQEEEEDPEIGETFERAPADLMLVVRGEKDLVEKYGE